jgi:hypothetical protein
LAKKDTILGPPGLSSMKTGVITRSFSALGSTAPKYSWLAQFTSTSVPSAAPCAFSACAIRSPQ